MASRATFALLCGAFVLLALCATTAADEACSADDGPISCESCREGADVNAVAGLPRVSQGGFVSSNLGYYDWFVCTDDGCTEWDGKDIESPKDERSPGNYIQSVATYFGFAIAMAVLSFVCFCCCCLWRMCGCCGGWTPTYVLKRNGKRRSCGCGFHRNLNPLLLGGDKFTYPTTQVLLVRLLMIVFVILTFVFIGVGQQMGNVGLTDSMKRLALAPAPTVNTVRKMITPGHDLVVDIASETLVPTVQDINATLTSAIDLDALIRATDCVYENAVVPPELDPLIDTILELVGLKTTVEDVTPSVERIFDNVDTVTAALATNVPPLQKLLDDVAVSKSNLTSKLDSLSLSVIPLKDGVNLLKKPCCGVASVSSDLQDASSSSSYPSNTDMQDAANGAANSPSLEELLRTPTSSMVGVESSTPRDNLITSLNAINAKFVALANTSATRDNVEGIVVLRGQFIANQSIADVDKQLLALENDISNLPDMSGATAAVNNILNALFDLNTTDIQIVVRDLNATIVKIPKADYVRQLIDAVFKLADLLPCVDEVIPSILAVDEKLLQLPEFVQDIKNLTETAKEAIDTARNLTNTVIEQLEMVDAEKDRIDLNSVSKLIGDIETVKREANESFSLVLANLRKADSASSVDLGTLRTSLGDMDTTINNPDLVPSNALLDKLDDAYSAKSQLTALIPYVVNSINVFAQGRCGGTTTSCSTDAECGGGTCQFAQKVCSNDGSTACTGFGSECGAGYCLFQGSYYAALRSALDEFAQPDLSDASNLITTLNSLNSEISSLDLDGPLADMDELKAKLQTIPLDSARTELAGVEAQREMVASNFTDVKDGWAQIKAGVGAIPDPDSVKDNLDMMKDHVDKLNDVRDNTKTFGDLLRSAKEFLFETLPPLFAELSSTKLDQAFEKDGILGTYMAVYHFARNITEFLSEQQATFSRAMDAGANLTFTKSLDDITEDIRPRLKVLSEDSYFANGPYYFIMSIMEEDTVQPDDPKAARVWVDSDGNKYADDKLCVTTKCIHAEVDFINTAPLSDVLKEHDIDMPIPMNRQNLTGVPFIFPGLAALLGLIAAVCCCPKTSRWQRIPTCLSGCLMCFTIPLAFFLAGTTFVFVIIGADTCRGGPNVGYNYISAQSSVKSVCDSIGSVSATDSMLCNVSIGGDDYIDVDVVGAYADVFGVCSSNVAAWNSALSSVEAVYRDMPVREANNSLNSLGSGSFSLRPPIKADILEGARRAGQAGSNFIANVNGVLTCNEVNNDFAEFKEAFCCDVMTAMYWSIGAWNLLAWIMCCCGCPACVFGYKRFPRQPWGSAWKEQQRLESAAAAQKAQDDAMRMGAGGAGMVQMVPVNPGMEIRAENPMRRQQPPMMPQGMTTPAWGSPMPAQGYGNGKGGHKLV